MKGHYHVGMWRARPEGEHKQFHVAYSCDSAREADVWLRTQAGAGTYSLLVENGRDITVESRVVEPQSRNVVTTGERRIVRKRKDPEPVAVAELEPQPSLPRPRGRFF